MLKLDPLEVAFEFTNLNAFPLLVDLLDEDLRIAKSQ
jgi:hypothetical protein